MKKLLSLALALCLVLTLCACGSAVDTSALGDILASLDDIQSQVDALAASQAAAAEAAPAPEAEPEPEPEAAPAEASAPAEIQVFIAASLDNAFQDIVALYNESHPEVTVTLNADSSGTLLTQIEEGFACDIFFSAAVKQMKSLEEDGLVIDGTRVDLLKNQLALITWKGSGTAVTGLENLGDAASIALADGSVPAGKYTRAALQALGILDAEAEAADITTEEVSEALGGVEINETSNVSKTLMAVAEGSNEVGTVYYSDAYSEIDSTDIIEMVSTDLTGSIIYPMCRVQNQEADEAETAAADDFYEFLQTPEVMAIFENYMFISNVD